MASLCVCSAAAALLVVLQTVAMMRGDDGDPAGQGDDNDGGDGDDRARHLLLADGDMPLGLSLAIERLRRLWHRRHAAADEE